MNINSKQASSTYYDDEGFSSLRIDSLSHQIREIAFSECKNILEIGIGGNILKFFLSNFKKIKYTGMDIDIDLKPDIVASVVDIPFIENSFDLTLCCQVLEHIPFEYFYTALREIRRITRRKVILSLPDQRKRLGLAVCLPKIQWKKFEFNYRLTPSKNKDKWHQWEIGYRNCSYRRIKSLILDAGFNIENQFRLEKHAWHCFFILDTNKFYKNDID